MKASHYKHALEVGLSEYFHGGYWGDLVLRNHAKGWSFRTLRSQLQGALYLVYSQLQVIGHSALCWTLPIMLRQTFSLQICS